VLVSAFFSPLGVPAEVLTLTLTGELKLLVDQRILDEYRDVLLRPEFGLWRSPAAALDFGRRLRLPRHRHERACGPRTARRVAGTASVGAFGSTRPTCGPSRTAAASMCQTASLRCSRGEGRD